MSHVFRRPHDYRPQLVAVAVLFGTPAADDAVPKRSTAQESFWAAQPALALHPSFFSRPRIYPEFLGVPDSPPMALPVQDMATAAYRPDFQPRSEAPAKAILTILSSPLGDDPPAPRPPGQERTWAAWRPGPPILQALSQLAAISTAPEPTDPPPLARPPAQELFWQAYRPPFQPRSAAVVPPETLGVPDAPPFPRPAGQEAAWSARRPVWMPPQFVSPLAALLGAPAPDDPPFARDPAERRFWAAYRAPWSPAGGGASLPISLFPPPDDPPLRSTAQAAAWAAYRPPYMRPAGLVVPPFLMPEPVIDDPPPRGSRVQEMVAAGLRSYLVRPVGTWRAEPGDELIPEVPSEFDILMGRLDDIEATLALILSSVSGTLGVRVNKDAEILALLSRLEKRVQMVYTTMEKKGIRLS